MILLLLEKVSINYFHTFMLTLFPYYQPPNLLSFFGLSLPENPMGVVELSFEGGGTPSYLHCVSTTRPATGVKWELNNTKLSDTQTVTVLNDTVTSQYITTLTLNERKRGLYRCCVLFINVQRNQTLTDFAELEVESE